MRLSPSPHDLPALADIHPREIDRVTAHFPMRISRHYRSLIRSATDPIARQVIPNPLELADRQSDPDPLREESQAPAAQIIHRYPHRVIFLVSNQCAVYCRFCMRKRRIDTSQVTQAAIDEGMDYIGQNPDINEVILSGGDPLMLEDHRLMAILNGLRSMPHIHLLRIHTRIPNAWPQRITADLAAALASVHPLYVNIHFNHPDEISPQARTACALLADAGIPLGSQTVLLQGVNDNTAALHHLFHELAQIRVRPYYLHQLDRVPGTAHFKVPLERSLELINSLRGTLSGQAMPHFMVDLPAGGGKVELLPNACVTQEEHHWVLRNFEGQHFTYPLK